MVLSAAILAGGALASGALGVAGSNASSKKQYEYQRRLQEQAAALNYHYNTQWAKNSPSFTRQGLESAGYNPMLAVQNGTSNAASYTSTGQAQNVDYNSSLQSGVSNSIDVFRLKNETRQSDAMSDSYYANADKAKAEKAEIIQRLPYVSAQAKANYMKTAMESAKLENDIHYQDEQLNLLKKQIEVQQYLGQLGFANAKDIANIQSAATRYAADKSSSASRYGSDKSYDLGLKSIPPKWAQTLGGILGTGLGAGVGVYSAIKRANKSVPLRKYR